MRKYALCVAVMLAVLLTAVPAFSQVSPAQDSPAAESAEMNELSIYGEVQSVNTAANTVTVQYYDYDSDEEKSMEISSDAGTKLENVTALGDINKADWVDVTYVVSGGKNIAQLISVEKEDIGLDEEAPTMEE